MLKGIQMIMLYFSLQIWSEREAFFPVDRCRCLQPCIKDRISFKYRSEKLRNSDSTFHTNILVYRMRNTKVMVLTYGLADLLADTGGYLGLLLGASLLSVYGTGRKLTTRIFRQAMAERRRRRHRRQQTVREEDEEHHAEAVWSHSRGEAASDGNDIELQ